MVGGWRCGDVVVEGRLVQNNDSKRKTATSKITARMTRIIPFKQRWGNLSEHRLSDITDLGTFMVFCEFHILAATRGGTKHINIIKLGSILLP